MDYRVTATADLEILDPLRGEARVFSEAILSADLFREDEHVHQAGGAVFDLKGPSVMEGEVTFLLKPGDRVRLWRDVSKIGSAQYKDVTPVPLPSSALFLLAAVLSAPVFQRARRAGS